MTQTAQVDAAKPDGQSEVLRLAPGWPFPVSRRKQLPINLRRHARKRLVENGYMTPYVPPPPKPLPSPASPVPVEITPTTIMHVHDLVGRLTQAPGDNLRYAIRQMLMELHAHVSSLANNRDQPTPAE